jgi:hypothetical protein
MDGKTGLLGGWDTQILPEILGRKIASSRAELPG